MKREVQLEEISDGKLYCSNDLVKADTGNCDGCSACCHNMGISIQLDPYDIYRLTTGLHVPFEQLLQQQIELNVVEGLILPNLKMSGENASCGFLSAEGRCQIHPFRPGICRLFPLGRVYEDNTFHYFLQTKECKKDSLAKVKVKKWLDTPDLKQYEQYICKWHYFIVDMQRIISQMTEDAAIKRANMLLLQCFFLEPYHTEESFYSQFDARLKTVQAVFQNEQKVN